MSRFILLTKGILHHEQLSVNQEIEFFCFVKKLREHVGKRKAGKYQAYDERRDSYVYDIYSRKGKQVSGLYKVRLHGLERLRRKDDMHRERKTYEEYKVAEIPGNVHYL